MKTAQNKNLNIQDLLNIKNPEQESIYGIIGRMEMLLEIFHLYHEYSHLIPFLEVYYLVTKRVAQKAVQNKGFFDDFDKMNYLDVVFASRYFGPLEKYLLSNEKSTPWNRYFDYCEENHGFPFIQMLLGINSHINGDLVFALHKTGFRNQKDFLLVNDILMEVIPDIVNYLIVHNRDIFALGGLFMRNFFLEEFRKTIVKWRNDSWMAYQSVKNSGDTREIEVSISEQTERIADEVMRIFADLVSLVKIKEDLISLNHLGINAGEFKTFSLSDLKSAQNYLGKE